MLNIEDLKVGDELEFISDKDREEFIETYGGNVNLVYNCFNSGIGKVVVLSHSWVEFYGIREDRLCCISNEELKYFRKVEEKKEVVDTPAVDSTYVNAGIKSTKEMYTRLLEGEVFYFEDEKYIFEDGYFYTRYEEEGGGVPYINLLEKYKHFQIKKPWYEFASEENPILCRVREKEGGYTMYEEIIGYHKSIEYPYQTSFNSWFHAEPVKPSECFQG